MTFFYEFTGSSAHHLHHMTFIYLQQCSNSDIKVMTISSSQHILYNFFYNDVFLTLFCFFLSFFFLILTMFFPFNRICFVFHLIFFSPSPHINTSTDRISLDFTLLNVLLTNEKKHSNNHPLTLFKNSNAFLLVEKAYRWRRLKFSEKLCNPIHICHKM